MAQKRRNGERATGNGGPVNAGSDHSPLPVARCPLPVSRFFQIAPALVLLANCTRDINLLSRDGGGSGGAAVVDAGDALPPTDATNPACTGLGPPIVLPTNTGAPCAGALAALGHRFALCSCETMTAPARVRTDAYDSRNAGVADEIAAAIGIGGDLNASAEVRAGGALWVAGANGISATNSIRAATSLRVGGPMVMHSDHADIGGDAYITGSVTGDVRVSGTLHVSPGATVDSAVEAATVDRSQPVSVAAPCDCSAGFVDIAGAIATATTANADADIGLSPAALASVTAPMTIELPCGTFSLSDINATSSVTLAVHGRTLLAVAGDVTVRGGLTVQLDPAAELDLLVGGQLIASGGAAFGASGAAARFRVWIAGTSTIVLDDAPPVNAVLRAPSAWVNAASGLPLSGSLLARDVSIGADSTLHFDRAVLEAGAACGAPASAVVP
jgi:hypothetical protein